ncbi:hypothetical protein N7638_05295 [Achromobacter mucicolens]|nr:hypothetical protein [Achromobacter mucicolens]MDG9967440.1 hypothetical protein [Achromobacter mucicolens]
MRTAVGVACALAMLLCGGPAFAQYVVRTQDMSGKWSVPNPHY